MFNFCLFYFVCPIFILKLDFVEKLVYLVWLDLIMFYYVEIIQITNESLSNLNIVVLQKKLCVIKFNSIEFNSCHLVVWLSILVKCHASYSCLRLISWIVWLAWLVYF